MGMASGFGHSENVNILVRLIFKVPTLSSRLEGRRVRDDGTLVGLIYVSALITFAVNQAHKSLDSEATFVVHRRLLKLVGHVPPAGDASAA